MNKRFTNLWLVVGLTLAGCGSYVSPVAPARASLVGGTWEEAPAIHADPAQAVGPSGDLAVAIRWVSEVRTIQATSAGNFPDHIAQIEFSVQATGLNAPRKQTFTRAELAGGQGILRIEKLPVGTATIEARFVGTAGEDLGAASSSVEIKLNETTAVPLQVTVRPPSGKAKVTLEAVMGAQEEPVIIVGDSVASGGTSQQGGGSMPATR